MEEISKLISEFPLYRKIEIDGMNIDANRFNDLTFDFYCLYCKNVKTFKLHSHPSDYPPYNYVADYTQDPYKCKSSA
jgi:hypothetical protein